MNITIANSSRREGRKISKSNRPRNQIL